MKRRFALFIANWLSLCAVMPTYAEPAAPTAECQCPPTTPKEQSDLATYVFHGDVWDVAFERPGGRKVIELDVSETVKGSPPSRLEVRDEGEGTPCALDFHEGEMYVVYARWRWGSTVTSRCWGTKRLEMGGTVQDQGVGPTSSQKAKYYERLRVYCMGRLDTTCCLSSLKAMRAKGYLPQPEQGCPDEMVPDRLRCAGSYVWCIPTVDHTAR